MKFKAMTNKEWVQKYMPCEINNLSWGGVFGCPFSKGLENHKCGNKKILSPAKASKCFKCWNLPAKRNGKYIMRRVDK